MATAESVHHSALESSSPILDFDEDGFLVDPNAWTPMIAQILADLDELGPLSDTHKAIISYLREHYLKFGTIPAVSHVCHVFHLDKCTLFELFYSFRAAWRIAGLPNPGEEAKTYML